MNPNKNNKWFINWYTFNILCTYFCLCPVFRQTWGWGACPPLPPSQTGYGCARYVLHIFVHLMSETPAINQEYHALPCHPKNRLFSNLFGGNEESLKSSIYLSISMIKYYPSCNNCLNPYLKKHKIKKMHLLV